MKINVDHNNHSFFIWIIIYTYAYARINYSFNLQIVIKKKKKKEVEEEEMRGLKTAITKVGVLLWSVLSLSPTNIGLLRDQKLEIFPPTCNRIECPAFDVLQVGNGFEICKYNSSTWISTSPIQDISLVEATRTGFLQLFSPSLSSLDYFTFNST